VRPYGSITVVRSISRLADAGLCYRLETVQLQHARAAGRRQETPRQATQSGFPWAWRLFSFSRSGLTLLPAYLPMLRFLSSMVVCRKDIDRPGRSPWRQLIYWHGATCTGWCMIVDVSAPPEYSGARLQSPRRADHLATFFVLFAGAMFGAFDLRCRHCTEPLSAWQSPRGGRFPVPTLEWVLSRFVAPCIFSPGGRVWSHISNSTADPWAAHATLAMALRHGPFRAVYRTCRNAACCARFRPALTFRQHCSAFGLLVFASGCWSSFLPG